MSTHKINPIKLIQSKITNFNKKGAKNFNKLIGEILIDSKKILKIRIKQVNIKINRLKLMIRKIRIRI